MKKYTTNDIPLGFPFRGTMDEFEILLRAIDKLKSKLDTSDSPREIIFESWFIFDYYIRRMILNGLEVEDFENNDLDLMYELLPQSFDLCLKIFERLLKNQREIYDNKKHPNTFFKFQENTISFQGGFIAYLINEKNDLFNDFFKEYWDYLKRSEPDYFQKYNNWDYDRFKIHKVVKKTWLESCINIDDEWFVLVRKLNKCRNKAAHLYDDDNIYSVFGINGNCRLENLKIEIHELIRKTLSVS